MNICIVSTLRYHELCSYEYYSEKSESKHIHSHICMYIHLIMTLVLSQRMEKRKVKEI
jgi:hypothetical protein